MKIKDLPWGSTFNETGNLKYNFNLKKQDMSKNNDKHGKKEKKYGYQVIRVTHLPEDTPKEKILKEISNEDLSEARQIAVNVLQEEMEWLEGKYSVESKFNYNESKGVGYAIVMNLLDYDFPELKSFVEGSYKQTDYQYDRIHEATIFENLDIEYSHDIEEQNRNYDMSHYGWHYQVEITENGKTVQVDFKAENGYRAGFEAKNFCLGRKLVQENEENASIDLYMVGISPYYKKPWKRSLLNEDHMINVRSWETHAFYDNCAPLSDNLKKREKNLMTMLRGKEEGDW